MSGKRGNIGSIHWYNRRKVTKENQLPYCRCVGLGTLIVGLSMPIFYIATGVESITIVDTLSHKFVQAEHTACTIFREER